MNNGDILSRLIEEDFGIRGHGRWYRSIEHSSLTLDYEKGIFYYNAEGIVGDPLVYLTRVRRYSFDQAKEYLRAFEYVGTHVYTIRGKEEDIVVYPRLVEIFFDLGRDLPERRSYFYRRGLTDDTIDRFQLGWYNDYHTIPFFEDGTFRNFQVRRDIPTKRIKSYYAGIGPLLFNSDLLRIVDTVFYTEGPVDAMILSQNGLPAISSNCGGGYRPEWYSKFIRINTIYILFDNDSAGVKEAKRLAKFLGEERCLIYTFSEFDEEGYDPVDYFSDNNTKEDLMDRIKEHAKKSYLIKG